MVYYSEPSSDYYSSGGCGKMWPDTSTRLPMVTQLTVLHWGEAWAYDGKLWPMTWPLTLAAFNFNGSKICCQCRSQLKPTHWNTNHARSHGAAACNSMTLLFGILPCARHWPKQKHWVRFFLKVLQVASVWPGNQKTHNMGLTSSCHIWLPYPLV